MIEIKMEKTKKASRLEQNSQLEDPSFEQVLYLARRLGPSAKIKLIRTLAQDLENLADRIAPLEPFKTYHIYTPLLSAGNSESTHGCSRRKEKEQAQEIE